jgi:hypothetical protein
VSKRLALLILVALLFIGGGVAFLVAFFSTPPPAGSLTVTVNAPSGFAQPSAPACSEVFVPGKVVDIKGADFACTDPDGTTHFIGGHRCKDGRHLWPIEAQIGAPEGWAIEGQPFHKAVTDDVENDPEFGKAYEACL